MKKYPSVSVLGLTAVSLILISMTSGCGKKSGDGSSGGGSPVAGPQTRESRGGKLPDGPIENVTPEQLKDLSADQISLLTHDQIHKLSNDQIEALILRSEFKIQYLSDSQVQNLGPALTQKLSKAQVTALISKPGFDVANLSGAQVGALGFNEMFDLSQDRINSLVKFPELRISEVPHLRFFGLSSTQMQGLTESQIKGLTKSQLRIISTSKVQAFTKQQVNWLIPMQGFNHSELTETQLLEADGALLDKHYPNIKECCVRTTTGESRWDDSDYELVRNSRSKDPYLAGVCGTGTIEDSPASTVVLYSGVDYRYHHLTQLGKADQLLPFHYYIPSNPHGYSNDAYSASRLRDAFGVSHSFSLLSYFSYVATGGASAVYRVLPGFSALGLTGFPPGYAIDTKVVKVRTLRPFGKSFDDRKSAENSARRDLALWETVNELAKNYEVHEGGGWTHLIEAVPYDDLALPKRRGIFIQDYISGKSAFEIAELVVEADTGYSATATDQLRAMGFADVHAAKRSLALLEKFYHLTHLDILHFEKDNDFGIFSNWVVGSGYGGACNRLAVIGIDFNHGRNVHWSGTDKKWHLIDY